MMERNDRSPPAEHDGLLEERRFQLRRLTVRRRHERPDSERRRSERRRSGPTVRSHPIH